MSKKKKKQAKPTPKRERNLFYHPVGEAGKVAEIEGERKNSPFAFIAAFVTVIAVFIDLNLPPVPGAVLSIVAIVLAVFSMRRKEPLARLGRAILVINIILLCVHAAILGWTVYNLSKAGLPLF